MGTFPFAHDQPPTEGHSLIGHPLGGEPLPIFINFSATLHNVNKF